MEEMSRNLVLLTRQVCLGIFVTSPCMSVFSLAIWQRYWHPKSPGLQKCDLSFQISKTLFVSEFPPYFLLRWRNIIFKCNCHDLEKMTLMFISLQRRIKFFRFWILRHIAEIIVMSQIDCCKGKTSQIDILWPIFLNVRFSNIVRPAGRNSCVE